MRHYNINRMRFSLRFVIPLLFAISLTAYLMAFLIDEMNLKWFTRDIDIRTRLITTTVHDNLVQSLESNSNAEVEKLFNKLIRDDRLYALAFCTIDHRLIQ